MFILGPNVECRDLRKTLAGLSRLLQYRLKHPKKRTEKQKGPKEKRKPHTHTHTHQNHDSSSKDSGDISEDPLQSRVAVGHRNSLLLSGVVVKLCFKVERLAHLWWRGSVMVR